MSRVRFREKRAEPPRRPPAAGGERVRRKPVGFASFLSRQVVLFAVVAFSIAMLDFVLASLFVLNENGVGDDYAKPHNATVAASSCLTQDDAGNYAFDDKGAEALDESGAAWAALVAEDGSVAWSYHLPEGFPSSFSASELTIAGHFDSFDEYPVYFWTRDDGVFVTGYPRGSYWRMTLSLPENSFFTLPLYALAIFLVDALVLFLLYAVAKRRTQRAVEPVTHALDELSKGRSATLQLRGDLAEVGDRITEVSRLIEKKDEARSMWIRGVSHDIRTPLSMMVGFADAIATRGDVPADVREQAEIIRAQGMKIGDLVSDLNTAAQLDYDATPKREERVSLARVVREACTDHVNAGFDEKFPLTCDIAPEAADSAIEGDARMIRRAIDNLLANARTHNDQGCPIAVSLSAEGAPEGGAGRRFSIRIADDGRGATAERIAALQERIAHAQKAGTVAAAYGEEHGLGLVLVDRICRAHGGAFTFSSDDGGFVAEMTLPE